MELKFDTYVSIQCLQGQSQSALLGVSRNDKVKMERRRYRPAVFVVTYKIENSRIFYLLLKRKLHWKGWEFPKGGIDKGEREIATVSREIKEETGLDAVIIKFYGIKGKYPYNKIAKKDRPGYHGQTYSLYSAQVLDGEIKLDKKEHSGFKWLEYDKAVKTLTWPNQRRCLMIVNKAVNF